MKKMKTILYFLVLVLTASGLHAQVNLQNSGTLYIAGANDTLYINGDFTNTSAAALTNNGRFYIKQNITNDQASMATGTGTLYLNGSSAQTISGAQSFKTYNLVTNNSAGITLNANLSVSGVHTYTSGMVTTSSTPNYLIYESGSSYTGDNDSRHVNGWVKKLGNSNFIFPVGDASYERTISISNLSASSEFNCRHNTPTSNIYNLFSPLVKVKDNEYWQLDQISGGTAQVTLNWENSKIAMDNVLLADILSAQYTSGNWTSKGGTATGDVTTTGTITTISTATFGPFTFGYKSFPVPLKLLSFSATRSRGVSSLNWVTENEYNVSYFDVQRSYDGSNFTSIGNVPARNSNFRETYFFDDRSALNGLAYYRIKSVDVDGKFSYSRIAVVSEYDFTTGIFSVINPVINGNITVLNKTGTAGSFDYRIFNNAGQLIVSGKTTMDINAGTILPLPVTISSGVYLLDIQNSEFKFRQKILVQK